MADRSSSSSGSFEFRPSQSIASTLVDVVCIAAVVYLAKIGVREPVVWSILSGLIVGRFGVAHGKTMERSNRGDRGGDSGSSGSWPSGPSQGPRTLVDQAPTEERDPRTFPRPIPREDPFEPRQRRVSSARARLAAWVARRRNAPALPWWARPSVTIPRTFVRVDAMSLVVMVVLVATIARVVAAAQ